MKIRRRASLLSPTIKALVLAGKQRDPRTGSRAQPGSHVPKMRHDSTDLYNHDGHAIECGTDAVKRDGEAAVGA